MYVIGKMVYWQRPRARAVLNWSDGFAITPSWNADFSKAPCQLFIYLKIIQQ